MRESQSIHVVGLCVSIYMHAQLGEISFYIVCLHQPVKVPTVYYYLSQISKYILFSSIVSISDVNGR